MSGLRGVLPDLHSTEVTLPKKGLIVASSNLLAELSSSNVTLES